MGVPKRKVSKMKKRQRMAANAFGGIQATFCANCGEPAAPHNVCKHCHNPFSCTLLWCGVAYKSGFQHNSYYVMSFPSCVFIRIWCSLPFWR